MTGEYLICTKCIMDTTDPDIEFDENGVCNHCREYARLSAKHLFSEQDREAQLSALVERIKKRGKGKEYDCVLGLSGGVDSSYVAYKAKELGLRPLAVHLDNGWNSELAVANIERIVKKLGIDLYTHVIDWEEFRELQLAFFKASVIDIELLTDHAILSVIYHVARRHDIRYFLSGYNVATESVMPHAWYFYNKLDSLNIKSIYKVYNGSKKLKTFPMLGLWDIILFVYTKRVEFTPLLNYISYDKAKAMSVLQNKIGWIYYGGKHYESRFTRFYQAYILPRKFHVDKRRAHLSSLIYSNQLTRDRAMELVKEDIYPPGKLREDKEFVMKKLCMTEQQFEEYMNSPPASHMNFSSYEKIYKTLRKHLPFLNHKR